MRGPKLSPVQRFHCTNNLVNSRSSVYKIPQKGFLVEFILSNEMKLKAKKFTQVNHVQQRKCS